eukprot:TRINITY_DN27013_c0_g1_i1.p1 TRINITY_DN27013_c0_g1~~TRINITY_DN27013_c0_g1_i1.p1  ORF type:complete len:125 (+),score=16.14 TRINITY_DN27013_c0_g1_i1:49-423(+)
MAAFVSAMATPCRLEGTRRQLPCKASPADTKTPTRLRVRVIPPQGWVPPPEPPALPRVQVRKRSDAGDDMLGRTYRHGDLPYFHYTEWRLFTMECEERLQAISEASDELGRTHRHGVLPLFSSP